MDTTSKAATASRKPKRKRKFKPGQHVAVVPTTDCKQELETDVLATIPLASSSTPSNPQQVQVATTSDGHRKKGLRIQKEDGAPTASFESLATSYSQPQIITYPPSTQKCRSSHSTLSDYQATDTRMKPITAHPLSEMTLPSDV